MPMRASKRIRQVVVRGNSIMSKGIWKQASKDSLIYNGRFVVSSKTTPKKSQPSSETNTDTEKDVLEENDGHQCHYGEDQVIQ